MFLNDTKETVLMTVSFLLKHCLKAETFLRKSDSNAITWATIC